MESVTVQTLTEFTKFMEEKCVDQSHVLFRGQHGDFPLLPSLARLPRTDDDILEVERQLLDELMRYSPPYLRDITPGTPWEWAALAQHHGLPTRLLDWSLNPLTSLWFAVSKPPIGQRDGVVWVFRPAEEDFPSVDDSKTLCCRRHMVFAPKHITARITAQVGWFTIHRGWNRHRTFDPLEQSDDMLPKLTKIIIPANRFAHFRFHLDRYGVNHLSVFPGLDGLCAQLRWKYSFMEDEGPL